MNRNNNTIMGKEINRGIYKLGFLEIWLWGKKKEQELKVQTGLGKLKNV